MLKKTLNWKLKKLQHIQEEINNTKDTIKIATLFKKEIKNLLDGLAEKYPKLQYEFCTFEDFEDENINPEIYFKITTQRATQAPKLLQELNSYFAERSLLKTPPSNLFQLTHCVGFFYTQYAKVAGLHTYQFKSHYLGSQEEKKVYIALGTKVYDRELFKAQDIKLLKEKAELLNLTAKNKRNKKLQML